jgi:hypothetical protein
MPVATKTYKQKSANFVLTVVLALLGSIGGSLTYWFFLRDSAPSRQLSPLTPEARDYVKNLKLGETQMKASENYMKSMVVELTGKITNAGDRALRLVELNCVFYDPYGQVILRERVPIVRARGDAFKPGETRSFRLPFDGIPQNWNQAIPQLVIARIDFEN